jgi:6-phosphofructokinase 1
MKRVAVLTSGGDAPGMNAAIRAVVRCGFAEHWHIVGVRNGYAGLVRGEFVALGSRDIAGIIQRGGTMLGSARCPEFIAVEGRTQAVAMIRQHGIDAVIVIGGNGSQTGAYRLAEAGIAVVGVASTIDNDLSGSDMTIGFDTALNIAVEAIDRLKVTASSHRRAFLVEVMGRDCGYLALMTAIAGGAEAIAIPEIETTPELIARQLRAAYDAGKEHAIVVVAEGAAQNAHTLTAYFDANEERLGFDLRVTTLGHVQRGGAPTAFDRLLATRLGAAAVASVARGDSGVLVGWLSGRPCITRLADVVGRTKTLDPDLIDLNHVLNEPLELNVTRNARP